MLARREPRSISIGIHSGALPGMAGGCAVSTGHATSNYHRNRDALSVCMSIITKTYQ